MASTAILALADGTVFKGKAFGAAGVTLTGEVVFNTSMTGYQEILTDPSYTGQIVTLTYPHIGNYGTNSEDMESNQVCAQGLIVRDLSSVASNFRSDTSLSDFLAKYQKPGIAGIDTRMLTRILREKGAQNGCLTTDPSISADEAVKLAQECPSMKGLDLAKVVSTKEVYEWTDGEWTLGKGYKKQDAASLPYHVVVYDFGIKINILRMLAQRGCRLTVVPAQTPAEEALKYNPDGIFMSNGPGDPEPCTYAQEAIKVFVEKKIPLFGICLGHQLLGLASGAKTIKMKFGHHGANHPVRDVESNTVYITSQNHGFCVDKDTLPANVKATHFSLFDGSLQGIERTDAPAFSFQGHPEASPGPHDVSPLFDHFIELMRNNTK
ncbi:MAG: glutamine-hydrolyzing carbamoyl-phosphate synthase small subunit [Anaerobiospirillum succiniciproducens]|uniref:glutamine-hydrolyzing carbamoyl-phosphate synthase small subunit n=1 Tax=Anaerobiospirillum succiniciproducens TaxID=13335 RepID=UPI00235450DA|nr:glutamine-hydrolyzing carbamoyl-phosphate synthase small subunit [Anaerobiospirillum succiniciproducens]MCI6863464.1 glutamine-hydrolyzing carbamoyl-phosphate synthase small subunit [Anaerobiospirillum succiniciproducens]MDO4676008.1 glutamine-hydrolyzing carbamoyl-phosphate synthase small subunit [Anaerobiospirillum succiniciproducens]MDY2798526.1 glutamine-hydrolyzing carbamoyl-phosphate synthase small subunit [Anaerobiospirillum succiniciproducens]